MFLHEFLKDLNKFKKLKTLKQEREKKQIKVHDTSSELYNELLETYYDEYHYLSHAERKKMDRKYKTEYDYSVWSKNEEESTDERELTDEEKSTDKEELTNKKRVD